MAGRTFAQNEQRVNARDAFGLDDERIDLRLARLRQRGQHGERGHGLRERFQVPARRVPVALERRESPHFADHPQEAEEQLQRVYQEFKRRKKMIYGRE